MSEDETTPRAVGRPSDYREEFAEQASKLCALGATDSEVADFFEIDRSTLYRWKHTKSGFRDALKVGKDEPDNRVERSLYQKATGHYYTEQEAIKIKVSQYEEKVEIVEVERYAPPDTTAGIFWLKNRRKDEWRDKIDGQMTLSADNTIMALFQRIAEGGRRIQDKSGEDGVNRD